MKKQILNISLLLTSSATIIAIWALPQLGEEEDNILYVRDYKQDILVIERILTNNNLYNGKEKKIDLTKNSNTIYVSKESEPSVSQSQKSEKKTQTNPITKTILKTDTIVANMKISDIKWSDYGRGMQFRKIKKSDPDLEVTTEKTDATFE